MLVLLFFPEEPEHESKQCDSSADDPACLSSPLVNPVEENEIHVEVMKDDRQNADDQNEDAKKAHGNQFLF